MSPIEMIYRDTLLTWYTSPQSYKYNSGDGILDPEGAAEVGGHITDYSCHEADADDGDDKTDVTSANICELEEKQRLIQ